MSKAADDGLRRQSDMSVENTGSPVSSSADSNAGDSIHSHIEEHEEYEPSENEKRENRLRPHLSHTSSIGGVAATQLHLDRTWTGRSSATANPIEFEVDYEDGDKTNPQNWPFWYKAAILFVVSYSTTAVVLYSTSYTSAIPGMRSSFGFTESEGIAGMTTYRKYIDHKAISHRD